jgi:uncharacterized protein YjbI with pentapeptide repeats
MNRIYTILSLIVFLPFFGNSQQLPVSATTIMNAPHPVYVNEYYSIGSNALQGIVVLNDLNEPSWNVRLLVTIEGEGIKIKTKQNFLPSNPINLTSGIPLILEGSDFTQYLNVNNVDLEGITAATLNQSGKLPEGIYNFCIEVVDYMSGVQLSLPSCAPAFIFFEPPPVTLQPECQGVVIPSNPQMVNFSWQIAGGASPTIAINSKYQLSVYEVTEEGSDPYFAVANNHALLVYESDFINQTQTQIDFGISTTSMLAPGKQYVYRVRAVDAEEKDIYRNNGFSEWCWFFYGYPHDGNLAITAPEDEHIFAKFETKYFGWEISDLGVPGQEFNYMAVIKELNEGQEKEDAMDANADWYVKNLPTTSDLNGGGVLLDKDTDPGTTYIWQVTAYTGAQEVAKSEIYTFYSAPILEEFYAGGNIVKVVSLSNSELDNLSGLGRIQVSEDEEDIVEFEFESLTLNEVGSKHVLVAGMAEFDLSGRDPLEIPGLDEENGVARVEIENGKVTNSGLELFGPIVWDFPHATSQAGIAEVRSNQDWFSLNSSYQLLGESYLPSSVEYEILEPHEFKITLNEASKFRLENGSFSLSLGGLVSTNDQVKTDNELPYSVSFYDEPSLYYFEASELMNTATNSFKPVDNLDVLFIPNNAVVDLSEEASPGKVAGNPSWKGLYFPEFIVRFLSDDLDGTNQLLISENVDKVEDLSQSDFWLENDGLQLKYDFELSDEGITFNGFSTTISGNFNVEDNQISSSKITGEIKIPVIDKIDGFGFEIPVTNDGLAQGYLNEDLTQRDMVFNPYGGENRVNIEINRAVFADNERLDLEIDAELVGIDATVLGITDFRIYGDNSIGVGSKSGSKPLDTQAEGEYNGFVAYVQEVGAALLNGNYVFSYIAALDMGEDVVGEDGPPLLAISSVEEVGGDVVLPVYGPTSPQPEPSISVPTDITPGESSLTTYEMFIAIDNVIVEMEGYLKLSNNDPAWGTSFRGGINGSLKVPTVIEVGANMIFGDRDGLKFWYFDAYFNDTEGLGIPVPPLFNLVAMEGKVYHHMSKNENEYIVDPDMAFGAGLYMQLIDNQTGGILFAVDAGAEIEVLESGDFTISMSGDGSFINSNRRTAGGGITSAVGDAIVEEVLEAIGPISLTFSVGGGDLTIEAEGLTKGSMDYTKGDLAFGFDAELGSTPGIGFNYSKGAGSLSFNANAAGSFGVGLDLDGKSLSLGIQGTNEGYLDLTYDDVSFATRVNRSNKTGTLEFAYGDKSIDFGVETDGGYLNLELSSDLKFETGFNTAGSAYLGLTAGTNEFSVSGDKTSGEGSFDLSVDGLDMSTLVNTLEKSASFVLNTSNVTLDVAGEYGKGGTFLLDAGGSSIDVAADLEGKTGHIDMTIGDKRLFAELTESSQGALFLKNGDQEFGISGNTDGTAGSVNYKDNTTEFTIAADRTNKTGNIGLSFDDKVLASGVSEDSSYINIAFSDVELNVQSDNQNKGMIEVVNGSSQIRVDADLEEKSGSLLLTDGTNSIYAKGEANATGELDINIDNNIIKGVLGTTESTLFVSSGDYEFSIEGDNDGNGLLGFKKGNIETRLGVNIAQTAGEIYVGEGSDFIHIKANKTENKGLIDLKKSSVEFTAALDDSIYMYSGPVCLTRMSDGTGSMKYNDGNAGVGLYKKTSEIGIGLHDVGNELYLSHGTTSDFDSVYYKGNGQTASASIGGSTGRIDLLNSLGSFGLTANTSGVGTISLASGELDVTVTGDINNESGGFEFEKGDISMDGNASISDESFGIGFEKGDIISDLDYTSTLQKINFEVINNFSISAQKENEAYATVFTKGDHSFKGTVEGTSKEIEYEGMGAKVILGNDREYVSYDGHSLLVQNNKVFVDDEEVYDYSNAPMTDVLDLTKVDFSQLDLSGVDFTGIDLSGVDISGINMSGLNFADIDLEGINFSGLDFGNVDISSLNFTGIDLSGMDLSGLDFTGISLPNTNLSGINFTGMNLSGITIPNVDLSGLDFTGIDFTGFGFTGVDLSTIDFSGVDFGSLDLSGIDLSSLGNFEMTDLPNMDLSGIDFTGLDLSGIDLSMIDFSGIDLSGIGLPAIDWPSVDLANIDFTGLDLSGIDLSMIDFSGIDLSGISLSGLNFTGFDFGNLDLSMVNFTGFNFPNLDLSMIDFSDLDWTSIDLSMIDFTGFDFPNMDLSMFDFSGVDFPLVPDVNWSQLFTFGDVEVRPYIDGVNSAVTLLKGADSIYVKAADLTDGMIKGYIDGNDILIKKTGSNYSLIYDDYEASLEGSELTIKQGATNQLHLTPSKGTLVYENYEVSASTAEGLQYTDGYNSTTISSSGISAQSGDKQLSYNQEKELFIQYEEGKNFKIHPQNGLEVNFDGSTLAISEDQLSYSEEGRAYSASPTELSFTEGDKQLIINEERSYLAYDAQNSIEFTGGVLTASHDDKTFTISDEKEITYNDPDRSLAISSEGMSLSEDGKSVSLSPEEMEIILSEDKRIKITEHLLNFQYEQNEVKLGSEALYFSDGTQTIDLSQDALTLSQEENSIYLSPNTFGLTYGANKSLSVDKADQKVTFIYDDIETSFSTGESLSFTDGTRSFELGTTGLSMTDGDKGLAVLNEDGEQAIELTNGDDRFFVNNSGFAIDYSGKHFAITEEEYLHVDIDDSRFIEVTDNSAIYSDNGTELIIGGDDNFLELKNGTKSIALTQDEKLAFVDGNYLATLSKDLEIEMTDGERTIGLFTPTHYVTYEQGDYELGIRGGSGGNKPGIDVTAYGQTLYVEGEATEDVTIGIESPDFGEVAFTVDAQKNIETRFISGSSVYGFIKNESGITPITGTEPVPPETEFLEGSGSVEAMDGPTHLTNSIADEAGGSIRGEIELSFDSKTSRFVANAAVAGTSPVCIEGAMALDVSPSSFKLDIGTEAQRIEVYPTCSGFGGGGWFGLESTSTATSVDVGVFVGWQASASVEIGNDAIGAGLSAEASAELGVYAQADILPDFHLREAGIWLDLYVAIKANYWAVGVSGSCTLAEAGLHGELIAKFLDTETQVSGQLSGYVTVLDIVSASFDMSFDTSF